MKLTGKFYLKPDDDVMQTRFIKDVARLFTWDDCCFRKMTDGWAFVWQPPDSPDYMKAFAAYDKVDAFDKFCDWLEIQKRTYRNLMHFVLSLNKEIDTLSARVRLKAYGICLLTRNR